MKILNYTDAAAHEFNNDVAEKVTGRVLIGKDDDAVHFCMRIFTVAPGGFTPRHAHPWEHEIFIHAGAGEVYNNGTWQPISSGTAVFIPGGEEHQIKNSGTMDLTFVCLIPAGVAEI